MGDVELRDGQSTIDDRQGAAVVKLKRCVFCVRGSGRGCVCERVVHVAGSDGALRRYKTAHTVGVELYSCTESVITGAVITIRRMGSERGNRLAAHSVTRSLGLRGWALLHLTH